MTIFYIENPNGKYPSEDGSKHYDKLVGTAAYEYLRTEEGKTKRFMKANDNEDKKQKVYFEIPQDKIKRMRVEERHEQHKRDYKNRSEILTVSLSEVIDHEEDGQDIYREDSLIAEESDAELIYLKKLNLEILSQALKSLQESELALITALYLQEAPMKGSEYAALKGITQQAVSKQKCAVLKKLKNFF